MENAGLFLMSKETFAAGLTAFFTFLSVYLFVRELYKGKIRPYIWAWVVRLAICIVAFYSQFMQGATYSLALAASQALCCILIIGLIYLKRPAKGRLDVTDWTGFGLAGLGVAIWIISGNPLFSLLGVILADTCATIMGIGAAIKKDASESILFWVCALIAASMALLSAKNATLTIILAPLFSCINALINILATLYIRSKPQNKLLAANQPVSESTVV
jgi:hypothetical protein